MPGDPPLLSVIVTSYNVAPYLGPCLDSITGQTLVDMEILAVDDGSTDGSTDIIKSYAERDPRIVPVLLPRNSPGGVATAANAGLARARGTYVGFADGDDLYDLSMFEKLVEAASAENADLAMCRYDLLDEITGQMRRPAEEGRWADVEARTYTLDHETRRQFLRFIAVPWRKLYRRSLLEANMLRFPEGDWFYEDNPFHWFSVISASSIAVVPQVLCWHRVNREGQTMQTADERLFRIFLHHDTIHAWLKEHRLEETYRSTLIAWVLSQLDWIAPITPENLRRGLYDTVKTALHTYSSLDYERSYAEVGRGERSRRMAEAIRKSDFAEFQRILDHRPSQPSLIREGLASLRAVGLAETARRTERYLRMRVLGRSSNVGAGKRPGSSVGEPPSNEHIAFALIVLQHRVQRLEAELARAREQKKPGH